MSVCQSVSPHLCTSLSRAMSDGSVLARKRVEGVTRTPDRNWYTGFVVWNANKVVFCVCAALLYLARCLIISAHIQLNSPFFC